MEIRGWLENSGALVTVRESKNRCARLDEAEKPRYVEEKKDGL